MAIPKIHGMTIQSYFWYGKGGEKNPDSDPYEYKPRMKEIAELLRNDTENDFDAEADDLEDAVEELESLIDRIASTFEDDIGYD